MLNFAFEVKLVEEIIVLALGFSWHWDTKGVGLTPADYREMLIQFLAHYNFMEYITTEPNIGMDRFNVLLARIGIHVPLEKTMQFYQNLVR